MGERGNEGNEDINRFGSWMIAQKRRRCRRTRFLKEEKATEGNQGNSTTFHGSQFEILHEEDQDIEVEVDHAMIETGSHQGYKNQGRSESRGSKKITKAWPSWSDKEKINVNLPNQRRSNQNELLRKKEEGRFMTSYNPMFASQEILVKETPDQHLATQKEKKADQARSQQFGKGDLNPKPPDEGVSMEIEEQQSQSQRQEKAKGEQMGVEIDAISMES